MFNVQYYRQTCRCNKSEFIKIEDKTIRFIHSIFDAELEMLLITFG